MLLTSVLDVCGQRDVATSGRRDAVTPHWRGCLLVTPVHMLIHYVVIVEDSRRDTQGKPGSCGSGGRGMQGGQTGALLLKSNNLNPPDGKN